MAIQLLAVCILFTGAFGRYAVPTPYPHKAVNYGFTYGVKDRYSGTDYARQEEASVDPYTGNNVMGRYHVLLPDGRLQLVTYKADENGYRAEVTYEGEAHHDLPNPYSSAHIHQHHPKSAPTSPAVYKPVPVPHLPKPYGAVPFHPKPVPTPPSAYKPVHVSHPLKPYALPTPPPYGSVLKHPNHLPYAPSFPHHLPTHHLHPLTLHPVHHLPLPYAPHHLHGLPLPLEGVHARLPANTYHLRPYHLATTEAPAVAVQLVPEGVTREPKAILSIPEAVVEIDQIENRIEDILEQFGEEVDPTENEIEDQSVKEDDQTENEMEEMLIIPETELMQVLEEVDQKENEIEEDLNVPE
ncbi:unnamed protein product, partial [Meganyctiphanes norvegica]